MTEYQPHNTEGWNRLSEYQRDLFGPLLMDWQAFCRASRAVPRAQTTYEHCAHMFLAQNRSGQGWMPIEDELIEEKKRIWTARQLARVFKRTAYEVAEHAKVRLGIKLAMG